MRTLPITQNVTLDGAVEMLGDWFDDQAQGAAGNDDLREESSRQDEAADALLVGRRTFLDFRGYWRDLEGDTTGISDYLDRVDKYVVTSTLDEDETGWASTSVLRTDGPDDDRGAVEAVREVKERPGRDILCTGSIRLCHALVRAGVVDEYRLFHHPVVQGRGRRLFPDGVELPRLRLVRSREFRNGTVLTVHRPAA